MELATRLVLSFVLLFRLLLLELDVRVDKFALSFDVVLLLPSLLVVVDESNSTPSIGIPLSFNKSRSIPILRLLIGFGSTRYSAPVA